MVMHVVPRTAERVAPRRMHQGAEPGNVIAVFAPPRYRGSDLVGEGQEIAMDIDQTLAVALAEADRRGTQEFEYGTAAAKLHAGDGARLGHTEFIAVPEPHRDARATGGLHYPANQALVDAAFIKTVSSVDAHLDHPSMEASALASHVAGVRAIGACRDSALLAQKKAAPSGAASSSMECGD